MLLLYLLKCLTESERQLLSFERIKKNSNTCDLLLKMTLKTQISFKINDSVDSIITENLFP